MRYSISAAGGRGTTMTADSEIRSRYLALALDARRIMDVLVPFAENGQVDQALDASVRDVIGALHSLGETADINPVRSSLAFDEYEQVLTVEEVKPREDRKAVIQDLQTILEPDGAEEKREAAIRVLQFLFALESRALRHYNRSTATSAYAR